MANFVIHTDINLLSVLDYAVNFLKVKHIVVCGHYGCGGVKASITNNDYKALLNMWLRSLKDVYRHNREELDAIENIDVRSDRLAELNVMEQVVRLSETTIIQNAWKEQEAPDLHGWVYGLKDGLLNPVMELKAGSRVDPIFRYDNIK
jgi:carbonic anhydrase